MPDIDQPPAPRATTPHLLAGHPNERIGRRHATRFQLTCPYTSNAGWRNLRDNRPEQWNEAVEFDRAIRAANAHANANANANANDRPLLGEAFLHPSLLPLDEAPIDVPPKRRHLSLVGADEAENWEGGDSDGCSPWARRSGRPEQPLGGDYYTHQNPGRAERRAVHALEALGYTVTLDRPELKPAA